MLKKYSFTPGFLCGAESSSENVQTFFEQYVTLLNDTPGYASTSGKKYRLKGFSDQSLSDNFTEAHNLSFNVFKKLALAALNVESQNNTGSPLAQTTKNYLERLLKIAKRGYKKNDSKVSNEIMQYLRRVLSHPEPMQKRIVENTEVVFGIQMKENNDKRASDISSWNCEYIYRQINASYTSTKHTHKTKTLQFSDNVQVQLFGEMSCAFIDSVPFSVCHEVTAGTFERAPLDLLAVDIANTPVGRAHTSEICSDIPATTRTATTATATAATSAAVQVECGGDHEQPL